MSCSDIVLKPRGKLKSWAQETCSGAHRHLARTMAWSWGTGSENIFFAGFWAQNDQFWGRNEFQNAEQFRTSKAEISSAVCLEFAETLFSNPFFEAAGALEFLSPTPIVALLWHPQTSSHLFLAFSGC